MVVLHVFYLLKRVSSLGVIQLGIILHWLQCMLLIHQKEMVHRSHMLRYHVTLVMRLIQ